LAVGSWGKVSPVLLDRFGELGPTGECGVRDQGDRRSSTSDVGNRFATLDGDPERGMRPLDGTDVDPYRDSVRPVGPDLLPLEGLEHRLERPVEELPLLFGVDAEPFQLEGNVAAADPEVQPTLEEAVDHGVLLGELDRSVEGEDAHEHAQAKPAGPCPEGREEDRRGGGNAAGVEVMFRDP